MMKLRLAAAFALLGTSAMAADPPKAPPRVLDIVEKVWPEYPESLGMFVDIVQGSQLGPNDGWFRMGHSRSRVDWPATRARLDRNDDGAITRDEFRGPDGDFSRLDRDGDKKVTANDFDFSQSALARTPGSTLFEEADADGNGKLTREEMERFFASIDRDNLGFLSLEETKAALDPPLSPPRDPKQPPRRRGPSKSVLLRGLYHQEIGSLQQGPRPGEMAPDFTLKTVDGKREITLSELVGPKPVVLIFGNITCGPFRSQAGNVEKLYRRYRDRVEFAMVYVREAHPTDGWEIPNTNDVALRQPQSYDERAEVARLCTRKLGFDLPVLVDRIDDPVGARYSGMPSRLYLIDGSGRVVFQNGRGPFGFKPRELEQALILHLEELIPQTTSTTSPSLTPGENSKAK